MIFISLEAILVLASYLEANHVRRADKADFYVKWKGHIAASSFIPLLSCGSLKIPKKLNNWGWVEKFKGT